MSAFGFLLSPAGRLEPRPFITGAIGVYLVGAASQLLLMTGNVAQRAGVLPFVAVQLVVPWIWFCLHSKRLHDAGRSSGLAVGLALLYLLSVVQVLIVPNGFFTPSSHLLGDVNVGGEQLLILIVYVVSILGGSGQYDLVPVVVVILIALIFLPIVLALAVTVWAARLKSQPSGAESQ
jgi:uncharacterized membrane protein YhaH (DUF805 family)